MEDMGKGMPAEGWRQGWAGWAPKCHLWVQVVGPGAAFLWTVLQCPLRTSGAEGRSSRCEGSLSAARWALDVTALEMVLRGEQGMAGTGTPRRHPVPLRPSHHQH